MTQMAIQKADEWYTVSQIEEMIGCAQSVILAARDAGELKLVKRESKRSREENRRNRRGFVLQASRDSLISWLVKSQFPIDEFRYKFAKGRHILACGLSPHQMSAMASWRAEFSTSLVRLGQLIATRPAWAIIVNFTSVGREHAMDLAAEFRRDLGRPYLVGLIGEDEATRPGRAADVYDVLFSADIAPSRLRAAIQRLRRCGEREPIK